MFVDGERLLRYDGNVDELDRRQTVGNFHLCATGEFHFHAYELTPVTPAAD